METSPASEYSKLPYAGRIRFGFLVPGKMTLWQAADHILCVSTYGFIVPFWEEYKRLYFADIEEISMEKTNRRGWSVAILLSIALIFVGLAVFSITSPNRKQLAVLLFVSIILALLYGLLALRRQFQGPIVRCRIRTPVQVIELHALARFSKARAFIETLRPLVAASQGVASQEAIAAAAPLPSMRTGKSTPAPSGYRGLPHLVFFSLLLGDAAFDAWYFLPHGISIAVAQILYGPVLLGFGFAALTRNGSDVPSGLRLSTWLGLLYIVFGFAIGFAMAMVQIIRHPLDPHDNLAILRITASYSPYTSRWFFWVSILAISWALILGAVGILQALDYRRRKRGTLQPSAA